MAPRQHTRLNDTAERKFLCSVQTARRLALVRAEVEVFAFRYIGTCVLIVLFADRIPHCEMSALLLGKFSNVFVMTGYVAPRANTDA